jgi:hypothetical protein
MNSNVSRHNLVPTVLRYRSLMPMQAKTNTHHRPKTTNSKMSIRVRRTFFLMYITFSFCCADGLHYNIFFWEMIQRVYVTKNAIQNSMSPKNKEEINVSRVSFTRIAKYK